MSVTDVQSNFSAKSRRAPELRVGFLASHPIQYLSPLLRALDSRVDLRVFYAHNPNPEQQAAAGFGVEFEWDTDLFSGYEYTFLDNVAEVPDAREENFFGCDTPELHEHISADRFDAFVVNGWYLKSFWQAVWACRSAGIPVLARGDSQLRAQPNWIKAGVKALVYRFILRAFDGFLSVGQRFDAYLRHYGIPEERIFRAPHCIDNQWFRKKAKSSLKRARASDLRQSLGTDGRVTLLFVGKLIPKKRPQDLVRVVNVLQESGVPALGVCVGAGPMESELQALDESLSTEIRFVGFKNQSELPAYYVLSDALLLPSEGGETWGLVVNEAMACGTPAVVSEAAGCRPDLVVDGKTGYGYPTGDIHALADAVQRLIADRDKGHDFESAVTQHIEHYSVESTAAHIQDAVHSIVGS